MEGSAPGRTDLFHRSERASARWDDDDVALHEIPASKYLGKPVVENFSGVVNNSSQNQHGIVEYLQDKTVARAI